jgi:mRNA interferase RelE/StbE
VKATFRKSFKRDLKKLKKNRQILGCIRQKITEVEAADGLQEIASLKKLSGGGNYYRIRVGDYRIGITGHPDQVVFVRCLHRRDIYRYFP